MADNKGNLGLETGTLNRDRSVDCFGRTFKDDESRRAYFRDVLLHALPAIRQIPGCPKGDDETIVRVSDPPYYTACPNPFLAEFVGKIGDVDDDYHREPYASDVSEGKTDGFYRAHGYHTKVPYKAIVRYLIHYTKPGDLVFDGFCGSGMTAVAAQMCGMPTDELRKDIGDERRALGLPDPKWGARRAVLNDISPAATFIAANFNIPVDDTAFARATEKLLDDCQRELGWMYETRADDGSVGLIDYTVWSEVFSCPNCGGEVVFLEEALDEDTKRVRANFACPKCNTEVSKLSLERITQTIFDKTIGSTIQRPKRKPALIVYTANGKRHEKRPDQDDLNRIRKIEDLPTPGNIPIGQLPFMHMTHQRADMASMGITHFHHFFLPRAAASLSWLWNRAGQEQDSRVRSFMFFFVEQAIWGMSLMNRYQPIMHGRPGGSQVNRQLSGVYYVASQHSEVSPWYNLGERAYRLSRDFRVARWSGKSILVTTGDCARVDLPLNSVDYIFTDPPFGENIYYADLNFLVEAWYRLFTDARPEAIVDKAKHKGLPEYQDLMRACLRRYYEVLKPGRWMTMVFHNSHSAVWNAIQEAMISAGFVVADVRTIDKEQKSYRQVTSSAMKEDLVVSAYKPRRDVEDDFRLQAGTEDGVWTFVREHLANVPVFVENDGDVEVVLERTAQRLYDRTLAYHIQRHVSVPMGGAEFFAGLETKFVRRADVMYFLPEQAAEWDKKAAKARGVGQLSLFVMDEKSAAEWLREQLRRKPQTIQELQPSFLKELQTWVKHERLPELRSILDEYFLEYDGAGAVPPPIHSYLSTNFHDLRNLANDHPLLREKARGRWYIPDPARQADIEKKREKIMLREFEDYRTSKERRLKVFRTEAVRVGFKACHERREWQTIIDVSQKIPEAVLQGDMTLLMYYDVATMRVGEDRLS